MEHIKKIGAWLSKRKHVYFAVAIVAVLGAGGFFALGGKNGAEDSLIVKRSDFTNTVSVSGKVVASEEVELGFKASGVVEKVYFGASGDSVIKAGTAIAKIRSSEADKELREAEINLASAEFDLEKFKLNNSDEELNKNLVQAYDEGFNAVADAYLDFATIINGLEDILDDNLMSDEAARRSGSVAVKYRESAEKLYYQAVADLRDGREQFRSLDRNSSKEDIEKIITDTYTIARLFADTVKNFKIFADYVQEDSSTSSDYDGIIDDISEYTNTISSALNSLSEAREAIRDSKNSVPSTAIEIKDLELAVRQKENILREARSNLADYYIRAPFDGVITEVNAKVGEIARSDDPLVKMMSAGTFQVESFVPEIHIALIEVNDEAKVTLDAYGDSVIFNARVVSIDPAETLKDGVSTYKVKLQFLDADNRIKSGMTANVSIIIFMKPNTLVLPGGVIFEKDGKKYVQVKEEDGVSVREVVLGDSSPLGQVEVLSGVSEGDRVVLNPTVE